MTKDEALRMALEALEIGKPMFDAYWGGSQFDQAITAIKKALAQPEQEPVAWESLLGAVARGWCYEENANKTMDSDLAVAIAKEVQALYTTPPQRKPLTDEQKRSIVNANCPLWGEIEPYGIIDDVEAAHGIKE